MMGRFAACSGARTVSIVVSVSPAFPGHQPHATASSFQSYLLNLHVVFIRLGSMGWIVDGCGSTGAIPSRAVHAASSD
jgi:hypothetical protein